MSMPKVTLLGSKGNTYSIGYGAKVYEFSAGIGRRVPVAIALLAAKKTRDGMPLFKVANMPDIVTPEPAVDKAPKEPLVPRQNVTADPHQQTFEVL